VPDRPPRRPRRTIVETVEQLTPNMVRVVVGGEGLEGFGVGEFTDHYVKLHLPARGADYGPDFDPEEIKATRPRELWPKVRTYSVRRWDDAAKRLTLDFVVHGDEGVAGPWATSVKPGDPLLLMGPGGGYTPDPSADWHLLVGDACVIPAVAASLPRIPAGVVTFVLLEVDGPEEEQPLTAEADLRLRWIHRSGPPGTEPDLLLDAVRALELPDGRGQVFVHGEATSVRAVRRHLVVERGIPADGASITGYWKHQRTDEGWREDKPEWKRLVEADVAAV
jgi:NADPH-dependent ferric siderophore reductase